MKYYVYSNLEHDKRSYRRGDTVDIDEARAQTLVSLGVIGTDAPPEGAAPQVSEPAPARADATVGSDAPSSGEPSLDRNDADAARAEAIDVTPQVSERMTREELEAVAGTEGMAPSDIEAAKTKADLVQAIEAKRAGAQQADASANL